MKPKHSALPLCLLLGLALLARCGWAQETRLLDVPLEFREAQALNRDVQAAALGGETKAMVAERFAALESQFRVLWEPVREKYDKLRAIVEAIRLEAADFEHEERELESQRPPEDAAEAQGAAFNARVRDYNHRVQESQEHYRGALRAAKAELLEVGARLDVWLGGPALADFTSTATAALQAGSR